MALPLVDVALSFAGEQRDYVQDVAGALRACEVTYFFDLEHRAELWGRNLVDSFDTMYRSNARFVVMFVSAEYRAKAWPTFERRSAQARALEELEPYILPVRFDDTDLPGLPPTVHFIDARGTTPEELAELIRQKVALARSEDPPEDREPGWEYLLLVDSLQTALAGYDGAWRDHQLRYRRPGPVVSADQIPADLSGRNRTAVKIVENVTPLFSEEAVVGALGAPGEPGDAAAIRHLAARIIDVYGMLLAWAADARDAVPAVDAADPVYEALSMLVDTTLMEVREFVADLDERLRPAVMAARKGEDHEPVLLEFGLTLTIPDESIARFKSALDAYRAAVG